MKTKQTKEVNNNRCQEEKLIDYFYSTKHTKFMHLLKISLKWKELYNSNEAKLSFIISILAAIIWRYLFNSVKSELFNQIIRDITLSLFESLIGMLGFIISGLAILTGTITKRVIESINNKKMIKNLISILYSFYFIGAFIGMTIIVYIGMYLMSFSDIVATSYTTVIISFILSYMFCFSIFYSIALLGTCLRIFLVSYEFSNENQKANE
ncbi:hypothetical protein PQ689_03275 [Thermoanaerobacterium thermosaccharolyticum]|uniref:hypothetical protein n=1 Tax=Thermoanaerobacterium thermosaccharolyticum TaxID=1517 RepID=UPI003D27DC64